HAGPGHEELESGRAARGNAAHWGAIAQKAGADASAEIKLAERRRRDAVIEEWRTKQLESGVRRREQGPGNLVVRIIEGEGGEEPAIGEQAGVGELDLDRSMVAIDRAIVERPGEAAQAFDPHAPRDRFGPARNRPATKDHEGPR